MKKLLKWSGIFLAVIAFCFVGLTIYRYPFVMQKQKSDATVAYIRAQKLTMADVDGKHLPPPPDPALIDTTIEGIDANQNGIRDDVELAIFEKYPNSPLTRSAELQYAMAEQLYLTNVFSIETWKAAAESLDRAYQCIGETYPRDNLTQFIHITEARTKEVEDLVFNTEQRRMARQEADYHTTSFGLPDEDFCDIAL